MRINKNFFFAVIMTVLFANIDSHLGHNWKWQGYLLIFLLSYPWESPDGNVYSLWGGFSKKNIYSACALFQVAEIKAVSIFGLNVYQGALHVWQGIGINFIQYGKEKVDHKIGFVFYQEGTQVSDSTMSITVIRRLLPLLTLERRR